MDRFRVGISQGIRTAAGEMVIPEFDLAPLDDDERIECVSLPDPAALVRTLGRLVAPGGDLVLATLNRTPKAFALAIVGAEYLLGMVPKGTHQYERFIRPSELDDWARAAGLELAELRGIEYQPLAGNFRLSGDVAVNYLAHFRRGAG